VLIKNWISFSFYSAGWENVVVDSTLFWKFGRQEFGSIEGIFLLITCLIDLLIIIIIIIVCEKTEVTQ
jgi:hypothetical protein